MITSAPARLIPVRISSAIRFSSIHPRSAAAFTMANSPETLYAATGCNHVCPSPRMAHCLPRQVVERHIVVDVRPAGSLAHHTAMAMVRVLTKTDIRDHQQLGRSDRLDRPHCLLHDATFVVPTVG